MTGSQPTGEFHFPIPVRIFGVRVDRLRTGEALERIRGFFNGEQVARVFFVYAHCLNLARSDPEFRKILNRAELVLNDGLGLEIAGRVFGLPFPENLCGTDFLPRVLTLARDLNRSVFLLGGREGIAETCGEKLSREFPGMSIAGVHPGFFTDEEEVVGIIKSACPDLLLVGMGVPLQEKWIDRWADLLPVKVAIGVGAFLDFYSEAVRRAPRWVRGMRMEWLFRFGMEPKRLWRRYLLGNPAFLAHLMYSRIFGEGQ